MMFYKKMLRYHSESKIRRHFSPATMAGYPKVNDFFCGSRYFCIKCCSVRRLTTIDVKGLLYLMRFLFCFFALIKVCYVYNNICSIVLH